MILTWTRVLPLAAAVAGVIGCDGKPAAVEHADEPAEVVLAVPPEPPILATVSAEIVHGWTGPGGASFEATRRTASGPGLSRRIGTRTFDLTLRVSDRVLTQYPCASCHQGARVSAGQARGGHENTRSEHPALSKGACTTCHVPGAVDRLALADGGRATLDQPYRLCAQCHFHQVDAWAAGIHGKRLDGWGGRRVVMNCTDCHDPHSPRPERRVPFPGPLLPRAPGGVH